MRTFPPSIILTVIPDGIEAARSKISFHEAARGALAGSFEQRWLNPETTSFQCQKINSFGHEVSPQEHGRNILLAQE
jgi:hypothetical protein